MHIHILGICGTFMGSLAVLAKELGYRVSGSDANVYPPMSTQLEQQGITLQQGYSPEHLQPHPDLVVIGNAMSRGNPAVEYVLSSGIDYCSGPQWLAQSVLKGRWVLAVAGTHGKTTTSSMLAWILEYAGLKPGYLIGGVARNFPRSAALGDGPFFVIEADEYDSAFFDKRSKFMHYAPRTAILNNLEFDHGDIFDDLAAIQRQFHHLVRTIPGNGLIISPRGDANVDAVLKQGCWSEHQYYELISAVSSGPARAESLGWIAETDTEDAGKFTVVKAVGDRTRASATVRWELSGDYNVKNAIAAVAAAHHAGVPVDVACAALEHFQGVRRRQELVGEVNGIRVYDDFAHHPTAIEATLNGMAKRLAQGEGKGRLIAIIEPRSNTMKRGTHQDELSNACRAADMALWQKPAEPGKSSRPSRELDLEKVVADSPVPAHIFADVDAIIGFLLVEARAGDHLVVMSNGGFGGIHQKLLRALEGRHGQAIS